MLGTIYIAGPMRGYELFNFPAFDKASELLGNLGWSVINPAQMDRDSGFDENVETEFSNKKWQEAMRRDYAALLQSNAIAFLPGWEKSEGAILERNFASKLGLKMYRIDFEEESLNPEHIIGLCGFAQSGKDTLAAGMVKHLGFERRAFADPMRNMLYSLNPLVLTDTDAFQEGMLYPIRLNKLVDQYGWEIAKKSTEVRSLLQRLGTESGRDQLGQNIWVDTLFNQSDAPWLVITDVRFPNEAAEIKRRGGTIIRVNRNGYGPINDHNSEIAYTDQDILLENSGSPEDLLDNFMEAYRNYYQNEEAKNEQD